MTTFRVLTRALFGDVVHEGERWEDCWTCDGTPDRFGSRGAAQDALDYFTGSPPFEDPDNYAIQEVDEC